MEFDNQTEYSILGVPRITADLQSHGFSVGQRGDVFGYHYENGHLQIVLDDNGFATSLSTTRQNGRYTSHLSMKTFPYLRCNFDVIARKGPSELYPAHKIVADEYEKQAEGIDKVSPKLERMEFGVHGIRGIRSTLEFNAIDDSYRVLLASLGKDISMIYGPNSQQAKELLDSLRMEFEVREDHTHICKVTSTDGEAEAVFRVTPQLRDFENDKKFIEAIKNGEPLFLSSLQIRPIRP